MNITFTTKGPFSLSRNEEGLPDRDTLKTFWKQAESVTKGIGVYIVASQQGELATPWYVGKTEKGFKKRFYQHRGGRAYKMLQEVVPGEDLIVVFLCYTTAGGKLKHPRKPGAITKTKAIKPIEHLESQLIGICHTKNRDLINLSNRVFLDGFSVPGYCGDRKNDEGVGPSSLRNILKLGETEELHGEIARKKRGPSL